MRYWLPATTLLGLASTLPGLAPAVAQTDAVADFYRKETVKVIVGYATGGGFDVYGRIVARHIGRHIPGQPAVIVQNMPGAGSLRSLNYLANTAPRDGTTFGIFSRDMPLVAIIGHNPNVRFDPRALTWLGSSSSYADDAYFLFVHRDVALRSVEEARKPGGPPLVIGGTSEGATGSDVAMVLRRAIGLNIRLIGGYADSGGLFLAVNRREIDARFVGLSATASSQPQWLAPDSPVRIWLQFARTTRLKAYPDVPTARELAIDDDARALIALAELPYRLSRPFAAPPGLPPERAQALQAAFLAVHRDPAFLADAAKLKLDISPIGSEAVHRALADIAATPPAMLETMGRILAGGEEKR